MTPLKLLEESFDGVLADFSFAHDSRYDKSAAYGLNSSVKIALRVPRCIGATNITISFFDESLSRELLSLPLKWSGAENGKDEYTLAFSAKSLGVGLYFARIKLEIGRGELYGYCSKSKVRFTKNLTKPDIQLTVSDFSHSSPESFYGGIIYQIFVDRFSRGGCVPVSQGAEIVDDWSCGVAEYPEYPGAPMKNNTFFGGTLFGIIDKLDYISSLGANIIYLSPIFKASSNHKYDTGDYMSVDEMFGGDEALEKLISECHKRGIKIILDGVFNHTGADSIYFNRYGNYDSIGAYQSKESLYYPWFDFQEFPNKYTSWWGIEILPRINTENSACRDFFVGDCGVVQKYASMGIDGFRLDVADELSDSFIQKIKEKLSLCGDNILYGEVWEDASSKIAYGVRKKYYLGSELDGVMNYPLRSGLIDYIKNASVEKLAYAIFEVSVNAPKRILDAQMNLLGTHDTERILTSLGGESSSGYKNSELRVLRMTKEQRALAKKRLMSLYTVLATLPGIPTIFYGDEAGLEGYSDPFNRMPYPWGAEDSDILAHYRLIGRIRRGSDAYKKGDFELLELNDSIFAFRRIYKGVSYVTVLNNSDKPISVNAGRKVKCLLTGDAGESFVISGGDASIYKINTHTVLKFKDISFSEV